MNTYEFKDNYVIGYTPKGVPFYFDREDYDKVIKYKWKQEPSGIKCVSDGEKFFLHNFLTGLHICHFINGNKNDCRKENITRYKGGDEPKKTKLNGYIALYKPDYHKTINGELVYEHIYIAENEILHRWLEEGECVHHKDENKSNNNLDNLMVFKTKADHIRYHKMIDYPEDYKLIKNDDHTYECIKIKDNVCPVCGKKIEKRASYCRECMNKQISYKNKINRDTLKDYIRIMPFEGIGRLFNVTGNTIKKWCKGFNLPYRKKDINIISDENWAFI